MPQAQSATVVVVGTSIVLGVLYGAWRLARAWAARVLAARDPIDALIAQNRAKPRAGMMQANWLAIDRAGERRWREVLRAQRRVRTLPVARGAVKMKTRQAPAAPTTKETSWPSRLVN